MIHGHTWECVRSISSGDRFLWRCRRCALEAYQMRLPDSDIKDRRMNDCLQRQLAEVLES